MYTDSDYKRALAGFETRPIWTFIVYIDLFAYAAVTSAPKLLSKAVYPNSGMV